LAATEKPHCDWPPPPAELSLGSGEVHIWCLAPHQFANNLNELHPILSGEEKERASRFHFSRDRESYVVRHALLRLILGRYLETDPSAIEFSRGSFGKPTLDFRGAVPLHFNDSHTNGLALLAVTKDDPLGVDIEHLRPIPDFEEIAANYFSPREVEALRAIPADKRMEAFYACWTRKEAFLKATGEGIRENLAKVEVALTPGEESRILYVSGKTQSRWKLHSFIPAPGYLGALTFQGNIPSFQHWSVPISFLQSVSK